MTVPEDDGAQGSLGCPPPAGVHIQLVVIPIGRALLYAEPIYLQANRSPMPELRLVVLAVQDRLAYGPTFESAMAALFGGAASTLSAQATPATRGAQQASATTETRGGAFSA